MGRVCARTIFLSALLLGSATPAWATSWWVEDAGRADDVRAHLQQLWPNAQVEVEVGHPPPDAEGLWYDGGDLVVMTDGREWRETASDLPTQVAFARSHLRSLPDEDAGWLPSPAPMAPPEAGVVEVVRPHNTREAWVHPYWMIGGGSQNRVSGGSSGSLRTQVGLGWNNAGLGILAHVDAGEPVADGLLNRSGGYLVFSSQHALSQGGLGFEHSIGGGARVDGVVTRGFADARFRAVAGATTTARVWSRPSRRGTRYGLGVGADLGVAEIVRTPTSSTWRKQPDLLVHSELSVLFGNPWRRTP